LTDDELRSFLAWDRSHFPFDQLNEDWKTWAKAVIQSAKVGVEGQGIIQRNDAVLYLCQIIQVFACLREGTTDKAVAEDDLRGKFVSGLVVSGLPPETDGSFYFLRALQDAQSRGYVTAKEVGWGNESQRFYQLELAGQKFADTAKIAEPSDESGTTNSTIHEPVANNTAESKKDQSESAKPVDASDTPPSDSTSSTNGTSQPTLTTGLATIIVGCKALQMLEEIRRFYSHVIADDEASELHRELVDAIEFWLSTEDDSLKGCREVYGRSTPENPFSEQIYSVLSMAAMIVTNPEHPELGKVLGVGPTL
jgi:hypothetical protein